MQARYYDPVIGRFYSNDPIGFRDVHSFNRYAYANNNPYKYVDPTGMISEEKREERQNKSYDKCQKDPNCSNLKTPDSIIERDYGSVSANLTSYSANGSNHQGNIACQASCQSAANAAFQFSELELQMGYMRMNYLMGQTAVFDNLVASSEAFVVGGSITSGAGILVGLTKSQRVAAFLAANSSLGLANGVKLIDGLALALTRSPTMRLNMRLRSQPGKPKMKPDGEGGFRFVTR